MDDLWPALGLSTSSIVLRKIDCRVREEEGFDDVDAGFHAKLLATAR